MGLAKFFANVKNSPEDQYTTFAAAPSQIAPAEILGAPPKAFVDEKSIKSTWDEQNAVMKDAAHLPPREATKEKGTALDLVVRLAGSRWALGFTLMLLIAWAVWGIVAGPTDTWQVILQDVSSIQAYFSATLLLRGQANSTKSVLKRICNLISRSESNLRMMSSLTTHQRAQLRANRHGLRADILASVQLKEDTFDKVSNAVANAAGSLVSLAIYWAGIIGWAFSGVPLGFSNTWQLDVNTATALQITLTTMFLQNIRQNHDNHLDHVVRSIELIDTDVEIQLRRMTGNTEENPEIHSSIPKLNKWTRYIDIYAYIVGGAIGLTISAIVFALWLAVGEPLEFDDNWWLIIGTYTGLMGFIDGFIMKNVDHRETKLAEQHFKQLLDQDFKLFRMLDVDMPETPEPTKRSLNARLSSKIGGWASTTTATYISFFLVILLITVASALQWTEAGQLLCNTPTMIVEGFFLIMLLQAHNVADEKKRILYDDILSRRLVLEAHLTSWDDPVYFVPDGQMFDEKKQALSDSSPPEYY